MSRRALTALVLPLVALVLVGAGPGRASRPKARALRHVVAFGPVTPFDPVLGNAKDALVTLVEFGDFGCRRCQRSIPIVRRLLAKHPGEIRFVFEPDQGLVHKDALDDMEVGLAAQRQGGFWRIAPMLFDAALAHRKLHLAAAARHAGLDLGKLRATLDGEFLDELMMDDRARAAKVGVPVIPTLFLDGVRLRGPASYPALEKAIAPELALARRMARRRKLHGEALYQALIRIHEGARRAR